MTPRQLKYFLRISELKSFTKAAAVLHIAQPALSRQIHQLEDELGVRLFARLDSGVTLTDAGEVLRERAAGLVQHFASVRDEVGALSERVQGRLHFGMPPSLFDMVTMPLLLSLRTRHPAVQPSVIEGTSSAVYELVLAGRLDFGVVLSAESMAGLHHRDLFGEQLFLACAADLAPEGAKPVPVGEVATRPLILTQRPNAMRTVLDSALQQQGLTVDSVIESNSSRVLTALVASGVGCTVLPYSALAKEVSQDRFAAAPIEGLHITWTLVHSKERALGLAAQRLVEMLLEVTAQASGSGRWPGVTLL